MTQILPISQRPQTKEEAVRQQLCRNPVLLPPGRTSARRAHNHRPGSFCWPAKPFLFFFFFFKLRVNIFFFLILLSWHSLLGAKELLRNQGLVRISIFSVYLLNFTFPDDSRLGRCAKSVSADTPPAVHLLFLLISFPRSILCQTYSSGVGRYLYIYRLQRENKSWTCYTTLKKQPNFQQTLFAV